MSKYKVIGLKLHAFIFIDGTQIGPNITDKENTGKRKCSFELEDNFLKVTLLDKKKSVLVPLANIVQLELSSDEKNS